MSFDMAMGMDTPRCGRVGNRNKGSLEVFGGAPRLLQAGVFAQAPPATSHEEDTPRTRSSLFESMMIDSTTASSLGRSLERSCSERTSGTQNYSQAMADRGPKKDWNALAAPPIRRYSLEEGKADPVYSGYQQSSGMISTEVQRALSTFQQAFVVTDATQPDCPIMFASSFFLAMTGYSHGEVIGRNCRFLQGPGTDSNEVARIREALRCERNFSGRLLNYKKNGRPFWNLLTITPIRDAHDRVIMCIGMQAEVSKHTEGCRENALRPNGLSASLIRYESRQLDQATDAVTEIVGAFRKTSLSAEPQADVDADVDKGHHPNPVPPGRTSNYHNVGHNLQRGHSSNQSRWDSRRDLKASEPCPSPSVVPQPRKKRRISKFMSLLGFSTKCSSQRREDHENAIELRMPSSDDEDDDEERAQVIRRAFDLATSLERIEKNFVITDPRLPDNPIIFASDQFLELTEYTREDVLGCNCRFLQGPETDPATVRQIKDAIAECRDITVQLVNYTKSGRPFWNLFHLQAVRNPKGELQYFIGVQQNPQGRLSDHTERERAKMVQQTATTIDGAVRELPDANLSPERLWALHSKPVFPKARAQGSPAWKEILKARSNGDKLGLKSFKPIKPLGCGDTGRSPEPRLRYTAKSPSRRVLPAGEFASRVCKKKQKWKRFVWLPHTNCTVHLVELRGTGQVFAMKAMDKAALQSRNKVHRACAERHILELLDHPFLPILYASFQTVTHVCLIMNFCPGSELNLALERQPQKHFREESARFYAAEIIIALEYLHCLGVVYRDLKPENVLIQDDGHVQLTDFDLSIKSSAKLQMMETPKLNGERKRKMSLTRTKSRRRLKVVQDPVFFAEPVTSSNSFVGTEEYIAPEIITGYGHSSAVDWWSLGILLYEMLYGFTPFKGSNRQKTFTNILTKELLFPPNSSVSLEARQLIQGLLERKPIHRLGSMFGAHDIKSHPFFQTLKWPLVRCMTPPPLEVPVNYTETLADLVEKSANFEWDKEEVASPF